MAHIHGMVLMLLFVDGDVEQVVQDQKNPAFLTKRKTELEAYLKEVKRRSLLQYPLFFASFAHSM